MGNMMTGSIDGDMVQDKLYKTKLCKYFEETGKCSRGNSCTHAHGARELLLPGGQGKQGPLYKTSLCKYFEESGTCTRGDYCTHAHGIDQLRLPN